jgi:hypothetical protein
MIDLTWAASGDGGSPITDYTIEYSGDGGSNWLTYSDGTSTDALVTVSGLSDDTTYLFRVSAVNAVGTGSASDMASATTAAVPGLPTGFTAAATYVTDYSVDLSWTAPDYNGSTVTSYTIEYAVIDESSYWEIYDSDLTRDSATGTSVTFTGAWSAGELHYFRVKATNNVGTGGWSVSTTATPTGEVG